jgi:hypothetical protein
LAFTKPSRPGSERPQARRRADLQVERLACSGFGVNLGDELAGLVHSNARRLFQEALCEHLDGDLSVHFPHWTIRSEDARPEELAEGLVQHVTLFECIKIVA